MLMSVGVCVFFLFNMLSSLLWLGRVVCAGRASGEECPYAVSAHVFVCVYTVNIYE